MTTRRKRKALTAMAVAAVAACMPTTASAETHVWTYDVLANAYEQTNPGVIEPITIVGARNGTFSGSVAVESTEDIRALRATMSPLVGPDGEIPGDRVTVRSAAPWDSGKWSKRRRPGGLDILVEGVAPPVPARNDRALAGVWVTVNVPEDATPGEYRGTLRVQTSGMRPQSVPVELTVTDWRVPDPQSFRTWVGMIQSPDTLALEYEVPMWSDRHWELIGQSFELMGAAGVRIAYVPLIARTNFGNEQSMVRWVQTGEGEYEYDFSIMEKYLDTAEENLGGLDKVVFQVWDIYLADNAAMPHHLTDQARAARDEVAGLGPRVTLMDGRTPDAEPHYLPRYEDEASDALWRPLFDELRQRMADRGVEDGMMLGMITDTSPSREETQVLHNVTGGLPWAAHAHPPRLRGKGATGNKLLHGIADVAYDAHVYRIHYQVNPANGRQYGWQTEELTTFFGRNGVPNGSALNIRLMPEMNITGRQRGIGRVGADFWYVMADRRGQRSGTVYHRYPENNWRNLDIESWVLAPGPAGPVGTARLENLREGLQEVEARIFIESTLLDEQKKARVGDELAGRAQALLDERQLAVWRSVWSNEQDLRSLGALGDGRNPIEAVWKGLADAGKQLPGYWDGEARTLRSDEARKGRAWFAASPWKQRNEQLFTVAAEIQQRLDD